MTLTAKDVKAEEVVTMRRVFDRPTPYALNVLRVKPATKRDMIASVAFKEFGGTPAKRFLNPEVRGGARSRKSHERQIAPLMRGKSYSVPGGGAPINQYGNVPGSVYRRIISHLGVSTNADANISGSARSKRKRAGSQYFVPRSGRLSHVVFERRTIVTQKADRKRKIKGKKRSSIKPVLVFTRSPTYRKRFPFYLVADRVVRQRFDINFRTAFARAMATARPPR